MDRELSLNYVTEGALYKEARRADVLTFVVVRLVGLIALAMFVLVSPSDVDWSRRLLTLGAVIGALPFVIAIEQFIPVNRRDVSHTAVNMAALFAVAALIPSHWLPMVLGYVALSMTLIGNGPPGPILTLVGIAGAMFGVLGWLQDHENVVAGLAFTTVLFALSHLYYRDWRANRARVDDRYELLVSAARLFFWEIDVETEKIVALHGDVEGALGWTYEEVVGTSFRHYLTEPEIVGMVAVHKGETQFDRVLMMRHRDGRVIPIRNQIRNSGTGRLQAAASDVTELAEAAEQIRHQSEHDELTGLLNRRGLLARIDNHLATSAEPWCLLAIDLVRFKEINDAFGHQRGDEVLRVIGERLVNESGSDVVARLGGNEFAVLLRCGGTEDAMTAAAERIGEVVRRPVAIGGAGIAIRASLGLAPVAEDVAPMELLRQADVAAHEAKLNRLSWSCFEQAPTAPIVERLTLAAELDRAIEQGQFKLWVQPKVSLHDHQLAGVEALARWHHPELGVLTPDRFIGLIEISEAYHRFSDAMVRQALDIVVACEPHWEDAEIAVNLHPRSFEQSSLVDRIGGMLTLSGVYPSRLKLEITEVDSLAESGTGLDTCRELAQLGVGISVDDFGTGYASLNRLRLVAPSEVKLDQSFIRDIEHNEADQTIVRSTVQLAESLGMTCVAEGVETEGVRRIVETLGCPIVQGYLFGRPMPVETFLNQLQGIETPSWELPANVKADLGT